MNIKESGEQFCYLLQPILINVIEGAEVFAVNIQYGKKKRKTVILIEIFLSFQSFFVLLHHQLK